MVPRWHMICSGRGSRVEAAANHSMFFFDVMGEMADSCAEGDDPLMCNPMTYVVAPLAGLPSLMPRPP